MANTTRYIIWAYRDGHSIFGPAANPVIRNGALLKFDDKRNAMIECDRLNSRQGNPHVRYSIKTAMGRRVQSAAMR